MYHAAHSQLCREQMEQVSTQDARQPRGPPSSAYTSMTSQASQLSGSAPSAGPLRELPPGPPSVFPSERKFFSAILTAMQYQFHGHDLPRTLWPDERAIGIIYESFTDDVPRFPSWAKIFPNLKATSSRDSIIMSGKLFLDALLDSLKLDVEDPMLHFIRSSYHGDAQLALQVERVDGTTMHVGCTLIGATRVRAFVDSETRDAPAAQAYAFFAEFFDTFVHDHLFGRGMPVDVFANHLQQSAPSARSLAVRPNLPAAGKARAPPRPPPPSRAPRGRQITLDDYEDEDDEPLPAPVERRRATTYRGEGSSTSRARVDEEPSYQRSRVSGSAREVSPPERGSRKRVVVAAADDVPRRRTRHSPPPRPDPPVQADEYLEHWGGDPNSDRPCYSKRKYPRQKECLNERDGKTCTFSHDPYYLEVDPSEMWQPPARR